MAKNGSSLLDLPELVIAKNSNYIISIIFSFNHTKVVRLNTIKNHTIWHRVSGWRLPMNPLQIKTILDCLLFRFLFIQHRSINYANHAKKKSSGNNFA